MRAGKIKYAAHDTTSADPALVRGSTTDDAPVAAPSACTVCRQFAASIADGAAVVSASEPLIPGLSDRWW